ncbi:MAG TPA: hypothetical protein VFM05_11865, partial [Candidatus Saccharimonadales bacterium]|nr:hypothetical protein [Candidatus Saccharimonadales bacterium]
MPSRQTKRKGIRLHAAATAAAMPASLDLMLPMQVNKAHLSSRKRNSLSERFPELTGIANSIKADTATIDGEIVALDPNGLPHFEGLRSRGHRSYSIVFYAFDLLYLDGYDLTACPLTKRKALLKRILPKANTGRIRFTDHINGSGVRLFEKLEALQLEGMVMKRKDSVYAFSRCRDWLKVKT